jgi:hypothetical protein
VDEAQFLKNSVLLEGKKTVFYDEENTWWIDSEAEEDNYTFNCEDIESFDNFGCCFPQNCLLPGEHLKSECLTVELLDYQEELQGKENR